MDTASHEVVSRYDCMDAGGVGQSMEYLPRRVLQGMDACGKVQPLHERRNNADDRFMTHPKGATQKQ